MRHLTAFNEMLLPLMMTTALEHDSIRIPVVLAADMAHGHACRACWLLTVIVSFP